MAPPLGDLSAPLGAVGDAASVHVPLALLAPAQAEAVAAVAGDGPVVITPWRGVVVPGGASGLGELGSVGLVTEEAAAWSLVSACVGAPGCAQALVDTRTAARALVGSGGVGARTHLSGCARRCGAPTAPYVDLVGDARTRTLVRR
ncbi:MAG: hypothetical protein ACLGIF_06215 [Actinomycetes bacterium]